MQTHFRTITGFVLSENLDTALIGSLVIFPLIGFVFGALGGILGSADHLSRGMVPPQIAGLGLAR
jgi:hypothetical protein